MSLALKRRICLASVLRPKGPGPSGRRMTGAKHVRNAGLSPKAPAGQRSSRNADTSPWIRNGLRHAGRERSNSLIFAPNYHKNCYYGKFASQEELFSGCAYTPMRSAGPDAEVSPVSWTYRKLGQVQEFPCIICLGWAKLQRLGG
jgi:hypothetical protein